MNSKIYLAKSRGSELFVKFETSGVAFGYDEIDETGVPVTRYLINFNLKQFEEIVDLWGLWKNDPLKLPKHAGYLKDSESGK